MLFSDLKIQNPVFKKEFSFITDSSDFQNIQNTLDQNLENFDNQRQEFKHQVTIPRYGKIFSTESLIKQSKQVNDKLDIYQKGYSRTFGIQKLYQKYQPRGSDMNFTKNLNKSYNFDKKFKLHLRNFVQVIQSCENQYSLKKFTLQTDSSKIINQISFELDFNLMSKLTKQQKRLLRQMFQQIIDYWKRLKIQFFNFPLIRSQWPKTQISMSKFNFWLPFKSRFLDDQKKKTLQYGMQGLGHSQKQMKLTKHVKQLIRIQDEVKQLAKVQVDQYLQFKKKVNQFQTLATQLGYQSSVHLNAINNQNLLKNKQLSLQTICNIDPYKNPIIKLSKISQSELYLDLHKQVQIHYDPHRNVLYERQIHNLNGKQQKTRRKIKYISHFRQNKYQRIFNRYYQRNPPFHNKKVKLQ